MKRIPKNTIWLVVKLGSWANHIYARFGWPVYLVGSATMGSGHRRDVDVVCEIGDNEFAARYGDKSGMYPGDHAIWGEGDRRWARDCGKIGRDACLLHKLNIDFKVQPMGFATARYGDRTKIRIDSMDGDPVPVKK